MTRARRVNFSLSPPTRFMCLIKSAWSHRVLPSQFDARERSKILNDTRIYSAGKLKRNPECHNGRLWSIFPFFDIFLRDGKLLQTVLSTERERSNYNLLIFVVFNERFSVFFCLFFFSQHSSVVALNSCLSQSLNATPGRLLSSKQHGRLFVCPGKIKGWRW